VSDVPKPVGELRRGWTTGACATAATKAALHMLWGGLRLNDVQITLPRGETPTFATAHFETGSNWVEVGITKDAGDDPDVTHGALIKVRVWETQGQGIEFRAGAGVGRVTMPGLPIAVGEPSINPVPRQMMEGVVAECQAEFGRSAGVVLEISIPGGEALAKKTWNPRLGIEGGLSILGTTGIVRPFSCAAWIASIHRGIDVARADGLAHVAGCTGATSEALVQKIFALPDHAMLDMGDFVGGLLKYLRKHPVPRITLGGGIGKFTKLAQGARDLHSARSQVDFKDLAQRFDQAWISEARTALNVLDELGEDYGAWVAQESQQQAVNILDNPAVAVDVVVIDRAGAVVGRAQ